MDGKNDEILDRITPSPVRRASATMSIGLLGILLIFIAVTEPPALGWLLFLIAMGAGAMALAWTMWQSSGVVLELTREELREENGRVLARLEDIRAVDRGFFAFKPAAGFRLSLHRSMPTVIAPGLWWRMGSMVMIGGVTRQRQARAFADLIAILVAEQHGEI